MNVSGVAMAKYALNRANAQKLMEFLVSREAQEIYAEVNFEYPVRSDVATSERVKSRLHARQSCMTGSRHSTLGKPIGMKYLNDGP